jgi:hypothetical protein
LDSEVVKSLLFLDEELVKLVLCVFAGLVLEGGEFEGVLGVYFVSLLFVVLVEFGVLFFEVLDFFVVITFEFIDLLL